MTRLTIQPGLVRGERFAGAFDYLEPGAGLRGWALEIDSPGNPLALQAVCKDVPLAESHCVMDRPDIDKPVGRATFSGFIIGWSKFDVPALAALVEGDPDAEIEIRIAATGDRVPSVREPVRAQQILAFIQAAPLGDMQKSFREVNEYDEIKKSGNFDTSWYLSQYGKNFAEATPPLLDYIRRGEGAGAWPNMFFDPAAYTESAHLPRKAGALLHYIRVGDTGYSLPSPLFNARWYGRQHDSGRGAAALAHYLSNRHRFAPIGWFDRSYYAQVSGQPPDSDLFGHFVTQGFAQGLAPNDHGAGQAKRSSTMSTQAADHIRGLAAMFGWASTDMATAALVPEAVAAASEAAPVVPEGMPAPAPAPAARPAAPKPKSVAAPPAVAPAAIAKPPVAKQSPVEFAVAQPPVPPIEAPEKPSYPSIEAGLGRMSGAERARAVQSAEKAMQGEGKGKARAEAALTVSVARAMAGDRLGAARAAIVYMGASVGEMDRWDTLSRLAKSNHSLYEQGRAEESLTLYRLLHEAGLQDFLVVLRLVESAVDQGNVAAATPFADELLARYEAQMNVWAWLALARYHTASGRPAKAVAILRAIPRYPATEAIPESVILHRLIEDAPLTEAVARVAELGGDLPPELYGPRFRIAVREADLDLLNTLTTGEAARNIPDWQLKEGMFLLLADGRATGREWQRFLRRLYRAMEQRGLENEDLVQARCHYLLQNRRWDELGALFDAIEGMPVASNRETLLRKLEYYCYADNPEGAEAIYSEHFKDTTLTKWEGLAILRLFSEQKRWDEAGKLLVAHVGKGYDFGSAGHTAMRVVRKASLHEAVLNATAALDPVPSSALEQFLGLVHEDQSILQSARGLTANLNPGARSSRYRSQWIVESSDHFNHTQPEHCLFLCTNQRYFMSLLTFLCSFLGQAPQVNTRIFAFLDSDVPRHWHGTLAMVAARFNSAIDIVPESDFIKDDVEHRVEYGFFAGGGALSRAAYFRLYAARYLLERHSFRRAAYIDTDIICRGDLSGLFEYDLQDKLLAAATEDFSLDVVNATARNNLDPLTYFNSGVLVLRFDSDALRAQIDEAIRISETEPQRLMFHDQCALNIAFNGMTQPLEPRYNFFLRPSRTRNGHIEDGLLLHFLDKPKPWDIVFDRSYREEWRVWALLLGAILPQRLYVDIFAAANRD